jgi:multiple sugar transport system permease protein
MAQISFKKYKDVIAMPPRWIFEPTLENYAEVLHEKRTPFAHYLMNSAIVGICSTLIALAVGIPAAYAFVRYRFGGKENIKFWILTTRMAPPIAVLIPYFLLFNRMRLIDSYISIIIMHITLNLALVVWMAISFVEEVPVELEEAALIDGCSRIKAFFRVTFPLMAPGIAAIAILALIFSWNDLLFALVLTGRKTATAPVVITSFISYQDVAWGKLSAASMMIMLPVIVFAFTVQKYILRGLTFGAVKG